MIGQLPGGDQGRAVPHRTVPDAGGQGTVSGRRCGRRMTTTTSDSSDSAWLLQVTIASAPAGPAHAEQQLQLLRDVAGYDPASSTWTTFLGIFDARAPAHPAVPVRRYRYPALRHQGVSRARGGPRLLDGTVVHRPGTRRPGGIARRCRAFPRTAAPRIVRPAGPRHRTAVVTGNERLRIGAAQLPPI